MPDEDALAVPDGAPDRLRLGMCQSVLRWVIGNVEDWTKGKNLDGADLILLTLFARSARTYEAVVRCLGESGFGEQGLMLNRSLFEDMIDAHWVSLNRDLAVERLSQHDLYSRLLRADTQRKHPRFFDGRPPPHIKVSNEERKALRKLYGRSGSRSWTGIEGIQARVASVKGCWPTDKDQEILLFWAAWVHKLTNEVLHASAFSLGRLGSPTFTDGESIEWHFGSTTEWLPQSLHAALWTFGQVVGLIIDEYHPSSQAEFSDRLDNAIAAFEQAAHWEESGRLEVPPAEGAN